MVWDAASGNTHPQTSLVNLNAIQTPRTIDIKAIAWAMKPFDIPLIMKGTKQMAMQMSSVLIF